MTGTLKVIRFPYQVAYQTSLELQRKLINQKFLNRINEPDYLILLELEPCITIGKRHHNDELIKSSIPIIKTPRGGRITYHGPGQLTCFPIIDLKRQPKLSLEFYVRNLAEVIKETLKVSYGIDNSFYDDSNDRIGLWLPGNKKIGFIGIQAQKWITSHGFSINIREDSLIGFKEIDPCGLKNQNIFVTCAEVESNFKNVEIEEIKEVIINSFKKTFQLNEE